MPHLGGRVIACLEARYASEMAELVTRHGGITYQAPCLREVHEPDAAETRLAVDMICGNQLDAVVFLTGVGVQTILQGASLRGLQEQVVHGLATKRVAARGPKTVNALRRVGARVDLIAPEPFTSEILLAMIRREWTLAGQMILVQRYGAPVPALTNGLRGLGAHVIEVSPYRWERPEDEEPVVRLIEDLAAGWIDVLAATNAAQVEHLFEIAQQRGHAQTLSESLARPELRVAAQGVVCAEAFRRRGVKVDLIPPRASMGSLIIEIADTIAGAAEQRQMDATGGKIAVFAARDVTRADVERVIGGLDADTSILVLSGKARAGDRLVEQVGVERGLAVQRVQPSRGAAHPADGIIRRATQVVILVGSKRSLDVGRILRLAERYAKPVRRVEAPIRAS